MKKINLAGKIFGYLLVISKTNERSHCGSVIWKCQCNYNNCGNFIKRAANTIIHGGISKQSCGCYPRFREYLGVGELSKCYFKSLKRSAKLRKFIFAVDMKWLWELFLKQNKKCALSGVDISLMSNYRRKGRLLQTASLDRIDSSKGYTKDNVQWIHKEIQFMKMDLSDLDFINWCKKIANFNQNENFNNR